MNQKPEWTLRRLAREAYRIAEEKGWHDKPVSFTERLCLIHSEISEMLEEIRNGHAPSDVYYEQSGKPAGPMIEGADVLIRLLELYHIEHVDPDEMVTIKMGYNETRSYRHGGKRL